MRSNVEVMFPRITIGIAFKLFCALLGAGIVMAAAMGVASRISFQQGFLGYLNELETQRLGVLTSILADVYREHAGGTAASGDDWSFLRGREDEWRQIVRASDRSFRASRDTDGRAEVAPRADLAAPGEPRTGTAALPRPDSQRPDWLRDSPRLEPLRPEPARPESARAEPPLRGEPYRRTTLLDAKRRVVAGNPAPAADAVIGPVIVDGRTVGWVANLPFRELTNAADLSFQERQSAAAWYIAALAVLLAGLTAWGLGRLFLAPATRLATAIHRLAAGRFDTRVAVTSSDELGRLAADFNRLAKALERNEMLRREFMADVSHELRTPLAIMRGELEAMEDGLKPLDEASIRSLQMEVASLAKLVDDIHQLSVADVGALSYRRVRFDVTVVLERILDAFRDRFGAEDMEAQLDRTGSPQWVAGDPDRLAQVFQNILENAVRYAGSGARVLVECRPSGPHVEIVFHDSGPGVPDACLEKLFERFFRLEASRNRATGGSGLGLAICRSIVRAHEGTITADRSHLGGLSLTLRLPAAAATGEPKT